MVKIIALNRDSIDSISSITSLARLARAMLGYWMNFTGERCLGTILLRPDNMFHGKGVSAS